MLFWKLLVAIDVLINIGYWRAVWKGTEQIRGFDVVSVPVGLIGTIGLAIYAFSLPSPSPIVWRYVLPAVVASGAWEIASAASKSDFDAGTLIAIGLAMLLVGFTSVALYRLGGSSWIGVLGI